MKLNNGQVDKYKRDGFLFLENYFSLKEIGFFIKEFNRFKQIDHPGKVMEKSSSSIRAMHGIHLNSYFFESITRLPRMLIPAEQVIGVGSYVFQFKINCKLPFEGRSWAWHQDYIFWKKEDGMKAPRACNIMIFLDEVTEFNGPLIVIPKSHRDGVIKHITSYDENSSNSDWKANISEVLKYSLDCENITRLVDKNGMYAPKGRAGSVLIFHPNIVHASSTNISPFSRRVLIVTYNNIENSPDPDYMWRPDFLVTHAPVRLQLYKQDFVDLNKIDEFMGVNLSFEQ